MQSAALDTSHELMVYRFGNGIKLVKPHANAKRHVENGWPTNYSVSTLLKIPCSIYFDNADGIIQQLNRYNLELCSFDSENQAIGKTYYNHFTTNTSALLLRNDQAVIKNKTTEIFEETILQNNKNSADQVLSIKMPWYNSQNRVAGLFGCSIHLGKESLADSLALMTKLGLLIPIEILSTGIGSEISGIYLSKQQKICAKFLLTGMTVKEIAQSMNLSPRTVDTYLDNMKAKFSCQNKTALILKLYEIMGSKDSFDRRCQFE